MWQTIWKFTYAQTCHSDALLFANLSCFFPEKAHIGSLPTSWSSGISAEGGIASLYARVCMVTALLQVIMSLLPPETSIEE